MSGVRSSEILALILCLAQRQSSSWADGKVRMTSQHSGERFDGTDLFPFHSSLFLRIPSVVKCGNWKSAVTCQVRPEPPAILLRSQTAAVESCLFPGHWSCEGQASVEEPPGSVTFGYALDQGSDGGCRCQGFHKIWGGHGAICPGQNQAGRKEKGP